MTNNTAPTPYTAWRVCLWAGPVFLIGYVLSWGILGYNIPPIDPGMSIGDLQAHYTDHNLRIRIGMTLGVFFGPLYYVFSASVSRILTKIEGPNSIYAVVEQMGGAMTGVVIMVAGAAWLTAAFRIEERTPEIIRALHDFAWMFFDTTYIVTTVQLIVTGLAVIGDRRAVPIIPKGAGWYSIAAGVSFLPVSLIPFTVHGAFAWNGLINYWVAFTAYFFWAVVFTYYGFKAIARLEREEGTA